MVDPVVALLKQGTSPEKLAQTFATGTVCSLFPFLGTTSALNALVGLWLRLNQPLLQVLNQLLGPLHLVMILVYVRLGEWLWRAGEERFTIAEMLRAFRDESFGQFLAQFGRAGLHAFTAWAVTAPLLFFLVRAATRPLLQRLAARRRAAEGDPAVAVVPPAS